MKKALLSFLFCLTIAACGPIYNTEYTFIPPASENGKFCAAQCIQQKRFCDIDCERAKANCEALEDAKKIAFEAMKTTRAGEKSSFDDPFQSRNCSDHDCKERCKEDRRECHITCGGEIQTNRVCVEFCD